MLQKLEEFAFGEMGLTPFDFYRMTLLEFENMRRGYENKKRADMEFRAYLTSWIVNSSGNFKKPIEVEDILPSIRKSKDIRVKEAKLEDNDREDLMRVIKKRRVK